MMTDNDRATCAIFYGLALICVIVACVMESGAIFMIGAALWALGVYVSVRNEGSPERVCARGLPVGPFPTDHKKKS